MNVHLLDMTMVSTPKPIAPYALKNWGKYWQKTSNSALQPILGLLGFATYFFSNPMEVGLLSFAPCQRVDVKTIIFFVFHSLLGDRPNMLP